MTKALNTSISIERYPASNDRSLKAWNAADELLIDFSKALEAKNISVYHDTFGYLSCHLSDRQITSVINFYSQQKAISYNLKHNNIPDFKIKFQYPLDKLEEKSGMVLMKVPKSVDLFELYLNQIIQNADEETVILCGFMTRNFSVQALKIAEKYFHEVSQSKAHKKARLMILRKTRPLQESKLIHHIKVNDSLNLEQYYGVFSAHHIDYATQFLLENLQITNEELKILDIGCGNGILGLKAHQLRPAAEIFLTDDNYLAIESAKLNLETSSSTHYYWSDHLEDILNESIDLALSNPPFHFEYENNIDTTLNLFREIHRCLQVQGRFLMVSNKHLNYAIHLKKIFQKVETLAVNNKFVVYECFK